MRFWRDWQQERERRRFPSEAVREYDLRLARLSGRVRCFQAAATRRKGWVQLDTKARGALCIWVCESLHTISFQSKWVSIPCMTNCIRFFDQVDVFWHFYQNAPATMIEFLMATWRSEETNVFTTHTYILTYVGTYIHTEDGGRCSCMRVILSLSLSTSNLWLHLYQGHHRCLVTGKWDSPSAILPATPLPVLFREPHPT